VRRDICDAESPRPLDSGASHGSLRSPFERSAVSLQSTAHSLRSSVATLPAVSAHGRCPFARAEARRASRLILAAGPAHYVARAATAVVRARSARAHRRRASSRARPRSVHPDDSGPHPPQPIAMLTRVARCASHPSHGAGSRPSSRLTPFAVRTIRDPRCARVSRSGHARQRAPRGRVDSPREPRLWHQRQCLTTTPELVARY